ncbi:MAG: hypothetical protein H6822_29540 [Planctomycetaceae bacterium]|nr:hypothetical protein [Planctomycetales bacterium]MCB9926327.1 hypothetical protein [Planctomycetaceae bacterium]
MTKNLTTALIAAAVLSTSIVTQTQAGNHLCQVRYTHSPSAPTVVAASASATVATPAPSASSNRTIYKLVQSTPQYDISRPEVVSGARITLFANFLRQEQGYVMFNLNGTSSECKIVEWHPNSVTLELPRLGLLAPQDAEIQIVLPDGRIAKTFKVLFVSQPDIVVHSDTIPQPMPPAPASTSGVYAMPVSGGLVLQAE